MRMFIFSLSRGQGRRDLQLFIVIINFYEDNSHEEGSKFFMHF